MNDQTDIEVLSEQDVIAIRREKLLKLRETKPCPFPNDFIRQDYATDLLKAYQNDDKETLAAKNIQVAVAGRIMLRRVMGKASFIHIQDMSGRIQAYVRKNDIDAELYEQFIHWDMGDIVGVNGYLFKTKTNELTIHVTAINLLTKSIRPLPDKFHGLSDVEMCYRQRYVDLIANESTRQRFMLRSQLIQMVRQFLIQKQFLEVETPMLQSIPGGAAARPFVTHHNALDMEMYLRIAPELYLKRLVVGGLERVFEVNRNFRNEGLSTRHNPEFTMLELYQAYANYEDLMQLTEELLRQLARDLFGHTQISYQGNEYDLAKAFKRMTVKESILHFNPEITEGQLDDIDSIRQLAQQLEIPLQDHYGLGKIQIEIFEKTVEDKLIEPTFITAYPREVSPLARPNDDDNFITDRFEFFLGGREVANGFSELNDPDEQAARFNEQVAQKAAGDQEAMYFDEDYITALEYGLPPTAGLGIGIDRLVMFFSDTASIRDVILFPHMRKS